MLICLNPLIFPVACTRLPVRPIILDHNHHESRIYPELGARRDGSLEPLTAPAHHQESLEELTVPRRTLTHGVTGTESGHAR
jgi:hypothetical protein